MQKICVITGANSGIGKASAIEIAKAGYLIVMVCRNHQKALAAKQDIISQTGNELVEIIICDFASQQSIRNAAGLLLSKFPEIDVLLNNAGFIADKQAFTEDGLESTFAVNHIGYFLFTQLLLDGLKKVDHARIVNVASEAHRIARFDQNNLQLKRGFSTWKAYGLSKLYNIMFTYELSKRLKGTGITVNSLHPGFVKSNFAGSLSGFTGLLMAAASPFAISNEQGAATSIYLCLSPEVQSISGKYFDKKRIKQPISDAFDDQKTARLWELTEQLILPA